LDQLVTLGLQALSDKQALRVILAVREIQVCKELLVRQDSPVLADLQGALAPQDVWVALERPVDMAKMDRWEQLG